ncbi:TolC family protein [Mucilaginibacter sp. PAMB04274]|uniref:TolC family protein n=1 Tax=Mucilaginibacter sp. PAMB04274 TaxID=3138568 RepID=UPI0031F65E30
MPRIYLAGLIIFISGTFARAQNPKDLPLSKAWQLAFDTYPGLRQKKAQIGETQVLKDIASSDRLPQAQAQLQNSIGTFAGSTGAFIPLPGIFNVNSNKTIAGGSSTTTNFYGSVVADWNLIGFGKINNAVKAADAEVQQAKSSFDAYHLTLQARVTRQYFDVLYNQTNLSWAEDNAKRVKQILELSKSLAEAGLKPGADTSLAAATYLQILAEKDSWKGKFGASKITLTETVPLQPIDFTMPVKNYLQSNSDIPTENSVQDTHPYLKVLEKQVQVSEARSKAAGSQALPTISLIAGYSGRGSGISPDGLVSNDYTAGFNNMANNYLVGVGVTWNITGAYTSALQKKRFGQQAQANKYGYDLEEKQLQTQLASATARLTEQISQANKTQRAVLKGREAYELYLSRYESGLIRLTELLQIQGILQQAEKNNIDTHGQLWDQLINQAEISGNFNYLSTQF